MQTDPENAAVLFDPNAQDKIAPERVFWAGVILLLAAFVLVMR